MSELEKILERCESPEFKEVAKDVTDDLWDVINAAINDQAPGEGTGEADSNWERFYLPALRHGVLRRLAEKCRDGSEGWYEVFCNNVREG